MNEKEFVSKFFTYLISFSASNFLIIRVLFRIENIYPKRNINERLTGGEMVPGSASGATSTSGFGIGGFVDIGGNVGKNDKGQDNDYEEERYTLPKPQRDGSYSRKSTSLVTNMPNYKLCSRN